MEKVKIKMKARESNCMSVSFTFTECIKMDNVGDNKTEEKD